MLEFGTQLLGREDPDVAAAVQKIFEEDGIDVVLGADTEVVEGRSGEGVRLRVKTPRASGRSKVPTCSSRRAHAEHARDRPRGSGNRARRARLRQGGRSAPTTAAGVWAMGECAGSPQFTHVAFDDFRVVRDNLAGKVRTTRDRLVPYCAFIDPELARVGLDETTAQQQRIAVRVARLPMTSVLRPGHRRDARVHEDADRRGQRPHPRLHDARRRCGRGDRRRADGDARRCRTPAFATPSSRTRRWPKASTCCFRASPGHEHPDRGTRPGALGR